MDRLGLFAQWLPNRSLWRPAQIRTNRARVCCSMLGPAGERGKYCQIRLRLHGNGATRVNEPAGLTACAWHFLGFEVVALLRPRRVEVATDTFEFQFVHGATRRLSLCFLRMFKRLGYFTQGDDRRYQRTNSPSRTSTVTRSSVGKPASVTNRTISGGTARPGHS